MTEIGSDGELEALVERPADDLFGMLGDQLVGGDGSLRDGGLEDARARAHSWFDRNSEALKRAVCDSPAVEMVSDKGAEVGAVADLISTTLLQGPAAFTVAAIIVKYGLHKFCSE